MDQAEPSITWEIVDPNAALIAITSSRRLSEGTDRFDQRVDLKYDINQGLYDELINMKVERKYELRQTGRAQIIERIVYDEMTYHLRKLLTIDTERAE